MSINEITYEIRGAIYDVYKDLGPGLLESVCSTRPPSPRCSNVS